MSTRYRRDVSGILLLDKPTGPTSNQVLKRARWLYQAKRAGHTGNLDPMATGMLPICLGQATKVAAFLLDADKRYRATVQLGVRTDTADADGREIERISVPVLDRDAILAALAQYTGQIDQVPPMYSALHHEGRRLYELAREGKVVERPPRAVTVHELSLVEREDDQLVIDVRCSKGTYIRTLAEDIAGALGTVGHLIALRRVQVEPFPPAPMHTLEDLDRHVEVGDLDGLDALLLPADVALKGMPALHLDDVSGRAVGHGQRIHLHGETAGLHRCYDGNGEFLGVVHRDDEGTVAPRRMFVAPRSREA